MAKKKEENEAFDLTKAIQSIDDWDWKVEAFCKYLSNAEIEIKSQKELEKQYKDFYGGK